MARLRNTGIMGFIASAKKTAGAFAEHFLSGFNGHGWKIWEYVAGKYKLEIDDVSIRGSLTAYELLLSQIRAIRGALGVTQAQGKIKTVTHSGGNYQLTFEEEYLSFATNDFVKCQRNLKAYHVQISDADVATGTVTIPDTEFTTSSVPEVGDELVQFGNSTDTARQSAIYIHADANGQPAIDVMFGINSKDWTNNIKIRLGGDLPGTNGAKGLYCENGKIVNKDPDGNIRYSLNPDGSGSLANGAISWDAEGAMTWGEDALAEIRTGAGVSTSLLVEFSANGTGWHFPDAEGDVYMHVSTDGGETWSGALRIKGETGNPGTPGTPGADGQKQPYHAFSFAYSQQTETADNTTAPADATTWVDTPPAAVSGKPYLWMRDIYYTVLQDNTGWTASSTKYFRVTGKDGTPGSDADADQFREDVATALGYASYDAMVAAATGTGGHTIIKNGYINTDLIDLGTLIADFGYFYNLIVRALATDTGEVGHKQRLVIDKTNHCIRIYNVNGTEVFSLAKTSASEPTYVQIGKKGSDINDYYTLDYNGLNLYQDGAWVACFNLVRGLKLPNDLPVDIPGFLGGCKVLSSGSIGNSYGTHTTTGIVHVSDSGIYSIGHDIGHTDFFVSVTPYQTDSSSRTIFSADIVSIDSNDVTICIKDDAGYGRDVDFQIIFFGKN